MRRCKRTLLDLHDNRARVSAGPDRELTPQEEREIEDARGRQLDQLSRDGLLSADIVAGIDIEPLLSTIGEALGRLPLGEHLEAFEKRYWAAAKSESVTMAETRSLSGWVQDVTAELQRAVLKRAMAEHFRRRDKVDVRPRTNPDPNLDALYRGYAFRRHTRNRGNAVRLRVEAEVAASEDERLIGLPALSHAAQPAGHSHNDQPPTPRLTPVASKPVIPKRRPTSDMFAPEVPGSMYLEQGPQPKPLSPALLAALQAAEAEEAADEAAAQPDDVGPDATTLWTTVIPSPWRAWLKDLEPFQPVALRTFDGLWHEIAAADRKILLGNAKLRLLSSKRRWDPWPVHASPVHLYTPAVKRPGGPVEEIWLDLTTGKPGRQSIARRMRVGIRDEVREIDRMISSVAHAMVRTGAKCAFAPADPHDRDPVMPAVTYMPWLDAESWQAEDVVEAARLEKAAEKAPHVGIDLLADPADIVAATPWQTTEEMQSAQRAAGTIDIPNGVPGNPSTDAAAVGLAQLHLSLVERKAQLLYLLRGISEGKPYDDPDLWGLDPVTGRMGEEPWVAEFAPHGLFKGRHAAEAWTRADVGEVDAALVEDLVCGILAPMGLILVARLERASDAMARIGEKVIEPIRAKAVKSPPLIVNVDGTGIDDPTRVMVSGGIVRPADAILSRTDRERLFSRSLPVEGSASDPGFHLPVGCVIVIPDGEPAYIRGRGWSTRRDGTLIAHGLWSELGRMMPFHLDDRARAAADSMGSRQAGMSPGPVSIYYRGYKWSLRRGGGPRRWDQSETEGFDRAVRMWDRHVAMMETGSDPDGLIGKPNPLRLPGYNDYWPFPPGSSNGVAPARFRTLLSSAAGVFDADAMLCLPYDAARWAEGSGPINDRPYNFQRSDRTRSHNASWERSWEDSAVHDRRWGAASLPPELFDTTAFRKLDGRPPKPGDDISLDERIAQGRRDADASRQGNIAAGDLRAEAALERGYFMDLARDAEMKAADDYEKRERGRDHRKRGRAEAERLRASDRARHAGTRLAYIPDPVVDGSDAAIEIVAYDADFRPEMATPAPDELIEHRSEPVWDLERATQPDPVAIAKDEHNHTWSIRSAEWAVHGPYVMGTKLPRPD